MKYKNIYLKYGEEGKELEGGVHAWNWAIDYTLCGQGNVEDFSLTNKRISCPLCIEIIEYCKTFKKNKHYKSITQER